MDEKRNRNMNDYLECVVKFQYGVEVGYREELVRCKDCVNRETSRCPCHYYGDPYIDWEPNDDWYCADGIKEGESK